LQYLALDPLVLDLSAKATSRKLAYATDDIDTTSLSQSECGVIKNVKKIVEQSRIMASSNVDEDGLDSEGGNIRIALDQVRIYTTYLGNQLGSLTHEFLDKFIILFRKRYQAIDNSSHRSSAFSYHDTIGHHEFCTTTQSNLCVHILSHILPRAGTTILYHWPWFGSAFCCTLYD
jgi:hypothetical protein